MAKADVRRVLAPAPHVVPVACAPNCYEFGFLQPLSEDGVVGERAIKRDTKIRRPIVVSQPFPIYNYVQLLVNLALCKWKVLDTVLATLGCIRQCRMRQSSPGRQLLFCRVVDSHFRRKW